MLLVPRADTGDADKQERRNLAVHKITVIVNHPPLDAPVNINQYATPVVEPAVLGGIRLDIEGTELDGTVRSRLAGLRSSIAAAML